MNRRPLQTFLQQPKKGVDPMVLLSHFLLSPFVSFDFTMNTGVGNTETHRHTETQTHTATITTPGENGFVQVQQLIAVLKELKV